MMKTVIYMLVALLLASCGSSKTANVSSDATREVGTAKVTLQSILSQVDNAPYREGELLVRFKSGVAPATTAQIHSALGSMVKKRLQIVSNLDHVGLRPGLTVKDAITRYMSDPGVEYAEPNYVWKPSSTIPNDLYFSPQQWALRNTGDYAGGTGGADIRATDAWDITRGSKGVMIAVLDTGVDYTHPELAGNLWINPSENPTNGIDDDGNGRIDDWRGWNFVFEDKNGNGVCDRFPEDPLKDENCHDPFDNEGHGTHVAGIIGAVGNNNAGISGLMWNVALMPLKVCIEGEGCPLDAIADGIGYAVSKNAKVINASLGGSVFSKAIQDSIDSARNAGILFVAAAGNDGANNDLASFFPAGYSLPNIITVAATDQNDRLAAFSNFGPSTVHVAAPGVYILSSVPVTGVGFSFSSLCTGTFVAGFDLCSGTSMAAPHVAGLAGLLWSYYPDFTYAQIRSTILRYVDTENESPNLETLTGRIQTGGRINAFKALSSLRAPSGLALAAQSPSGITLTWTDNATGEDGYAIERRVEGGSYEQIATLGPDTTTFTDAGLNPSTTYSYRVRATNNIGASPDGQGNEASAATLAGDDNQASVGGSGDLDGGCSVASQRNAPAASVDIGLLLLPIAFILILRRKR